MISAAELEDLAIIIAESVRAAIEPVNIRMQVIESRTKAITLSLSELAAELESSRARNPLSVDEFQAWKNLIESHQDAWIERVQSLEAQDPVVGPAGRDGTDGSDGKDADPELIRQMVQTAVDEIPRPQDGKIITVADVQPMVQDLVRSVVGKLPTPADGKDADPELIRQLVADAVAEIPHPKDGQSVTLEDLAPVIEAQVRSAVDQLPTPKDGKDADPEFIRRLVADAVAEIPHPKDGQSVTLADLAPVIEAQVQSVVSQLPAPRDGKDADPEFISSAVEKCVTAAIAEIKLPADGLDGRDGRDAFDLEFLPVIDEKKSVPRGTYAMYQGGIWRAYEKTHGMRGWECVIDGVAKVDVIQEPGDRSFMLSVTLSSGAVANRRFELPVVIDRGVYRDGHEYRRGDGVTWLGSYWIAQAEQPTGSPAAESGEWRLAVRKGRDGRNGKESAEARK